MKLLTHSRKGFLIRVTSGVALGLWNVLISYKELMNSLGNFGILFPVEVKTTELVNVSFVIWRLFFFSETYLLFIV